MSECDIINVLLHIDIIKTRSLRECITYHYHYFHKINFQFQAKVCNSCHDMTRDSRSFKNVGILTVKINNHKIHFWDMTKRDIGNRIENADFSDDFGNSDYKNNCLL